MRSLLLVAAFATLFLKPGAGVPSDYEYYFFTTVYDHGFADNDENAIYGTRPPFPFSDFLSSSLNLRAEVGDSVTFPCYPNITGDISVSWKRGNGQQIFLDGTRSLEDVRFQLVNGTSLQITDVDPSDSGQYVCHVSTESEMEQDNTLKVLSLPSFIPRCPNKSERWIDLGGDYCYLIEQEREVTWMEAVYECYKEGGYLATLRSIEEVKRIRRYFKGEELSLAIGLWRELDGNSQWVDKSNSDFRNWGTYSFNQYSSNCAAIKTKSGKFGVLDCDTQTGYVCSSLKGESPPAPKKGCPDSSSEWSDYGSEYCYIIEMNNKTTWDGAAEICSAAGGSLASFHSVQEISVVTEQTKHNMYKNLHIGFQLNTDGVFEWVDRSVVDLNFWDYDRMDFIPERCVEMNPMNGRWKDISCNKILGYICSTSKVNPEMLKTELPVPTKAGICGEDLTVESGTIQSPNYPASYGPNENCFWTITVPENYKISLTFEALELEYGSSCEFDYVEVLDGHEPDGTVLLKLCGSEARQTIMSLDNKMAVKFSSDKMNQRSGFHATFKKEEQCGGTIVAEEGIIRSPNYPENYRPNDVCTWKITVPEKNGILFKFETFELEATTKCTADYVEILDGHEESSRVLGRYCNSYDFSEIISSGHKITVRFVSDGSREYYGFSAEFKTAEPAYANLPEYRPGPPCGGVLDSEYGILLSPNYPRHYGSNEDCTWTIKPPSGSRINLRFKTLEIEEVNNCGYDFIEIYDGPSIFSAASLGRLCGDSVPEVIVSTGNEMTVKFITDSSQQFQGFSALFSTDQIVSEEFEYGSQQDGTCGGRISADEGVIESPNYPEKYGPNQNCTWKVTVPPNNQVVLKFKAFDVETHMRCMYDYVLVRDGDSQGSYILDKLCGYDIPNEIRSSGNKMLIEFKSDPSIEYTGFSAEFKKDLQAVSTGRSPQKKDTCGGDMYSNDGTIASPYYPELYGPLENCTWKITVPENYIIALKFDFLDVEPNKNCTLDYVTILDGSEKDSPVLKKVCNYNEDDKATIWSSKNKMTVKFVSDDSIERYGFSATFQKAVFCGGDIVADKGVLQTPDLTGGIPYICKWNIKVTQRSKVLLRISEDQMTTVEDGSFGVSILNGEGSPLEYDDDSYEEQKVFLSNSNEMTVVVESDGSEGLPHFLAEFQAEICGGDIVAEEGSIYSPNYPGLYPKNSNCTWKVTVPQGNRVVLQFDSFETEDSSTCELDFVIVRDGHDVDSEVLGKFCGGNIPDIVRTFSNTMSVEFLSDFSIQAGGFAAKFWKEPVNYPDIEETLRQLPHIIFGQAQQKRKPLFGEKNGIIKKRYLVDTMQAFLKSK